MADDGGDYSLCQRSIYADWRMTLAFKADGTIVIVQIAEHTASQNPNEILSEIFPGLSAKGRKRSDQPPCCDDDNEPPYLEPELEELLFKSFGI